MHIEIDVFEIAFLIIVWVTVKWVFRFLIIVAVLKVVGNLKAKAGEKIGNIRGQFEKKNDSTDNF
jgi:hypothetical protein